MTPDEIAARLAIYDRVLAGAKCGRPVARQWVQRGGFGPKPGPIRSLIVSGDPTAEEVAKCEQWLAAESDRISAVEKETNKCP